MFRLLQDCKEYKPNNIEYRITTSKWLGMYKLKQSESLNEIVYNAPNHKFSNLAKEIVLLKYNVWFIFSLWFENYLLKFNMVSLSDEEIKQVKLSIKNKAIQTVAHYKSTIFKLIEKEKWDKTYFELWIEYHKDIEDYILRFILNFYYSNASKYFITIISKLIDILGLTIFEVYELDHLVVFKNKFPIVYVDDTLLEIDSDLTILIKRLKLLKDKNIHYLNDKIVVKSYIRRDVLITTKFYKFIEDNFKEIVIE